MISEAQLHTTWWLRNILKSQVHGNSLVRWKPGWGVTSFTVSFWSQKPEHIKKNFVSKVFLLKPLSCSYDIQSYKSFRIIWESCCSVQKLRDGLFLCDKAKILSHSGFKCYFLLLEQLMESLRNTQHCRYSACTVVRFLFAHLFIVKHQLVFGHPSLAAFLGWCIFLYWGFLGFG